MDLELTYEGLKYEIALAIADAAFLFRAYL